MQRIPFKHNTLLRQVTGNIDIFFLSQNFCLIKNGGKEFFKIEPFEFEKFDFNEFFNPIFEKTKLLAEEKNIEISCASPQENVFVEGDSLHLRRLFFNIIHNAIKFTPSGRKISLAVSVENSHLKVVITDEGPGIPAEYLPQLFTRFFQVPGRDEDPQKGSGLGLNIAQSVAKAHQGTIEVQSQLNKGSVFTVTLPLA